MKTFVESCARHVANDWKETFSNILRFILSTQYVTSEFCSSVYKVIAGADMGLACSGDVCDITFYDTVESKILLILASFDVHCYLRFKDDNLVILSCDQRPRLSLIDTMRRFSKVWSLKVDSIYSPDGVPVFRPSPFKREWLEKHWCS